MDDDSNAALGSSSKLLMTQVNSYNQLSEELSSLSQDNQLITVVHYSTDWTTERTGSARIENELNTILENYQDIGAYIKVTDAKTAVRMGVSIVPTFEFYRGGEKVDQCSGADMYIFRESLDLINSSRKDTPYLRGAAQGTYPLSTGTLLPISQGT